MTLGEYFENKWFYMKYIEKYIGKYLSAEILLTRECSKDYPILETKESWKICYSGPPFMRPDFRCTKMLINLSP